MLKKEIYHKKQKFEIEEKKAVFYLYDEEKTVLKHDNNLFRLYDYLYEKFNDKIIYSQLPTLAEVVHIYKNINSYKDIYRIPFIKYCDKNRGIEILKNGGFGLLPISQNIEYKVVNFEDIRNNKIYDKNRSFLN